MGVAAYVLFLIGGLGFGYAAPGPYKLLPLLFPLALALGTIVRDGIDATLVLRLVLALALTGIGIAAGRALDLRAARDEHARYA